MDKCHIASHRSGNTLRAAGIVILSVLGASSLYAQRMIPAGGQAPVIGGFSTTRGQASGRFIVQFKPGSSRNERDGAIGQAGGSAVAALDLIDGFAVSLPNANAVAALQRNPLVARIAPDFVNTGSAKGGNGGGGGGGKPNDGGSTPGGDILFGTRQIVPLAVQRVGPPTDISNGEGVGIAILDSGIDLTHPDLSGNLASEGFSAFTEDFAVVDDEGTITNYPSEPEHQDFRGHGTHVAGLVAAMNNNFGIIGVAPNATLYPVKVLNSAGVGLDSHVIAGLQWVLNQNAAEVTPPIRVVNMSLGRPLDVGEDLTSGPLYDAVSALYNSGVTIVVAAGNDPGAVVTDLVPAGYAEVFPVASTAATRGPISCPPELFGVIPSVERDTASFFTTDGSSVVISAPGEEMEGTIWTGGLTCYLAFWGTLSTTLGGDISQQIPAPEGASEALGTSFSSPLVAGIVARLIQTGTVTAPTNGLDVEQIRQAIQGAADLSGGGPGGTPLDHPWEPLGAVTYTYDGIREGIAQAP